MVGVSPHQVFRIGPNIRFAIRRSGKQIIAKAIKRDQNERLMLNPMGTTVWQKGATISR